MSKSLLRVQDRTGFSPFPLERQSCVLNVPGFSGDLWAQDLSAMAPNNAHGEQTNTQVKTLGHVTFLNAVGWSSRPLVVLSAN